MANQYTIKNLRPTTTALRATYCTLFILMVASVTYLGFTIAVQPEGTEICKHAIGVFPIWMQIVVAGVIAITLLLLGLFSWQTLPAPASKVAELNATADSFLSEHIQRLSKDRSITRSELKLLRSYQPQA